MAIQRRDRRLRATPKIQRISKSLPPYGLASWARLLLFAFFQGSKPIAIRFGFTYNNTMYEIQSGFDPSLNGAGLAAIDMSIKAAVSDHLEVYDFLAFEGEYKQRFGADQETWKAFICHQKKFVRVASYPRQTVAYREVYSNVNLNRSYLPTRVNKIRNTLYEI